MAVETAVETTQAERDVISARRLAMLNWQRYEYGRDRGHSDYCNVARMDESFFLGASAGGLIDDICDGQWQQEDLKTLKAARRPAYEFNEIQGGVRSAIGYQIANRMDISFTPRGGMSDQQKAEALSKVVMQIADQNKLHWKETQVYGDGLIQQRGYYDIRMDYDGSIHGEVKVDTLDPMDVIPDPDAKEYDPSTWTDVIVTRWLTYDEIEQRYGKYARSVVENLKVSDEDFGDNETAGEERNSFGYNKTPGVRDAYMDDKGLCRVRIIDRQKWEYALTRVAITPDTGEVIVIESMEPSQIANMRAKGLLLTKRMQKRVRWTVTTYDDVLHDDYSPYPFFTVIPYFCLFRRGRTRGMVDPGIGPQLALNKTFSQYVHIINSVANSGWMSEENSLANMDDDELENRGAETGLHIVVKKGSQYPEKIQPNKVPEGVDRFIDRVSSVLKSVTIPDAARGMEEDVGESGIARQSKQFAAQQQMAIALDNLGRTRNMLAERIMWMVQNFYDDERVFRITETDPVTGKPVTDDLVINQFDPLTNSFLNDLTIGEYDVVITEVPMQITFENGQFEQAVKMRELIGPALPDQVLVKHSNLTDKADILEQMAAQPAQSDPEKDAKVGLIQAQTEKTKAETVTKSVEGQFSAIQTAQTIATIPQTAVLADALLRSAGYVDKDAAPIVPELAAPLPGVAPPASNTNPLTPKNPATPGVGMEQGIETPRNDSIVPVQ